MNTKATIGLALLLLAVIFIVQNAAVVNIQFLFWKISMSRSLMIFFVLAMGIVIGWITAGHFNKKHALSRKDWLSYWQITLSCWIIWWPGTESNCRYEDFQSSALPTELPGHRWEKLERVLKRLQALESRAEFNILNQLKTLSGWNGIILKYILEFNTIPEHLSQLFFRIESE